MNKDELKYKWIQSQSKRETQYKLALYFAKIGYINEYLLGGGA